MSSRFSPFANYRQPMPLARKLRLAARNLCRRVYRLQACCDHPGEPGC
ncbi:MAG: hypothetical protein HY681_13140 [Chloroflexi bacterium]|nr:hypothetical protein [Chloroflexota bacterium]